MLGRRQPIAVNGPQESVIVLRDRSGGEVGVNPDLRGNSRDFGGEEVGYVEKDVLLSSVGEGLDADGVGRGAPGGDGQAGQAHERRCDLRHLRLDHFGDSCGAAGVVVVGEGKLTRDGGQEYWPVGEE